MFQVYITYPKAPDRNGGFLLAGRMFFGKEKVLLVAVKIIFKQFYRQNNGYGICNGGREENPV